MLEWRNFKIIQKHEDGRISSKRTVTLRVHPESNGFQEIIDHLKTAHDTSAEKGWETLGVIETNAFKAIKQQIKDQTNAVHSDF